MKMPMFRFGFQSFTLRLPVSRVVPIALPLSVLLLATSCGDDVKFGAGRVPKAPELKQFSADALPDSPLGYRLAPFPDGQIVRPGPVDLQPSLHDLRANARALGEESRWLVTLLGPGGEVLSPEGNISLRRVDFSNRPSGDITLTAQFRERNGRRRGKATTVVRIDADAPKTSVLWSRDETTGNALVRWDVLDSADFNPQRSQLVLCRSETDLAAFQEKGEGERLSDEACLVLAEKEAFPAEGVLELENAQLHKFSSPGQEPVFAALSVDLSGNAGVFRGKFLDQGKSTLSLESVKASPLVFVSMPLGLGLSLKEVSPLRDVTIGKERSSEFEIVLVDSRGVETVLPYDADLLLPQAFERQGRQALGLYARKVLEPEVRSNTVKVSLLVDSLSPVVSKPTILVDGGVLLPGTSTEIYWNVDDASSIESQSLEWRVAGETEWRPLVNIPKEVRSVTLPWSGTAQKLSALEVRVTAVDALGLSGAATGEWREQFFNAAVVTKSVECFWCHLEVSGHVAGIFPTGAAPSVHNGTGTNLAVTGNFYSNVAFPGAGMPAVFSEDKRKPNYQNNELPIFPRNNDWPRIAPASLRDRMTGFLKGRDPVQNRAVYIDRVHSGNLVLRGTAQNPLELSGEVFVEGDLVIFGSYKGIGTIYARNIFIVDDLVGLDTPFPFPDDEQAALAAGREAVRAKKDALYLAALNDIVIGAPEARSSDSCTTETRTVGGVTFNNFKVCPSNMPLDGNVQASTGWRAISSPYSWLPKNVYQSLGRRAAPAVVTAYSKANPSATRQLRILLNSSHYPDETYNDQGVTKVRDTMVSDRTALEVSRVDAFLYATEAFQARVYVNLVINGGVMSPKVELLSAYSNSNMANLEARLEDTSFRFGVLANAETPPVNERNGMSLHRNAIRYDWRLRTGGKGMGVLKEFFR